MMMLLTAHFVFVFFLFVCLLVFNTLRKTRGTSPSRLLCYCFPGVVWLLLLLVVSGRAR